MHDQHTMHGNSLAAYFDRTEAKAWRDRSAEITDAFKRHGGMTDRQCAGVLGYPHKSAVQPRISELVGMHILREVGSVKDPATGKTVRVCALMEPEQMEMAL